MTFLYTFIFGIYTKFKPVFKWQLLRKAALTLVADIYKFRTLTGDYKSAGGAFAILNYEKLHENIDSIIQNVIKKGSITEGRLYKK